MMPNGIERAEVDRLVDEAFAAEGYTLSDGGRDYPRMRAATYAVLRPAKVHTLRERDTKAVTRNSLIAAVFPHLAIPADTGPQAATRAAGAEALAVLATWKEADRLVWDLTKPGPGGGIQAMVANDLGNGWVACRAKVTLDKIDAGYLTDDMACIEADYIGPDNAALDALIARAVRKRRMLVMIRSDDDQKRILRGYDRFTKGAITRGHDQLIEAIEAARPADAEAANPDAEAS